MFSPENLTFFTIIIYLSAAVTGLCGLAMRWERWRSVGCKLALTAFFCQTVFLIFGFHKALSQGLSMGAYLQMLAWFALLFGICAWWRLRQDALLLLSAPLALILFLMSVPSLRIALALPETLTTPFYALHIGSMFLSLGLLSLAFLAAVLFLLLERRIKSRKKLAGFWQDLPAITILDRIMAICALAALPFYTIGLIAGIFWNSAIYGHALSSDPKQIVSLTVWLLLAVLFHNRLAKNWRGRKPAWLVIVIFALSLFSFFVVNSLLTTQHTFINS